MNEIFKLFGTIGLNNSEANKGIDETTGKAQSASGKIAGFFKKAAVAIGTVFAAGKLIDFGKTAVEAAAGAKAIQAQFEQVFGDLQGESLKAIDAMAKEFGMVPSRLKPSMTKMTSMFKGLGMDTEEAMTQASDAVRLSADAAAFYDVSYESANQSLTSFIKGNYEGGEAIGIFANETQMAQFAIQKGLVGSTTEWSALDEATKQATRLEYAQNMQELGGATGQASREADGFENVMGNVKQAWQDFLALVGGPILEPVVTGLQNATTWLQEAGKWTQDLMAKLEQNGAVQNFKTAFDNISSVLGDVTGSIGDFVNNLLGIDGKSASVDGVADSFKKVSDFLADATGEIKDFVGWFQKGGPAVDAFKAAIIGITTAWAGYKVVTGTIQAIETVRNTLLAVGNGLMLARIAQSGALTAAEATQAAATMGASGAFGIFNAVLSANPIAIVIMAITALVAALVWFFTQTETGQQMWQGFVDFLGNAWTVISTTAQGVWNALSAFLSGIWSAIVSFAQIYFNMLVAFYSGIWNVISSTISAVWNGIASFLSGLWNGIYSTASSIFNNISSTISSVMDGISSTVSRVWNGIKDTISNAINGAKDIVSRAIEGIKGLFIFEWSLPRPKIPGFRVSGGEAPWGFMGKGSLPSIGVQWFADGGILTKAMAFGMNGNDVMVGGEAGKEAVLPLNRETLGGIGQGIASTMDFSNAQIMSIFAEIKDSLVELLSRNNTVVIQVDGKTIASVVYDPLNDMNGEGIRIIDRGLA
ncbi:phage tail protein [Streptococcus suis]